MQVLDYALGYFIEILLFYVNVSNSFAHNFCKTNRFFILLILNEGMRFSIYVNI